MTRTDWYGGLRPVDAALYWGDTNPQSIIACVQAVGAYQDREADTALRGRDSWPHPNTLNAMERHGLTGAEMPEFRRLKDMGFSPVEAANVIIRSRRAVEP